MVWFKTDDGFWHHRKVRKLGKDKLPAAGLWQLCGTWSAKNLTDGFVPVEVIKDFGDTRLRYARKLVEVGLWHDAEQDGETGFQYHQWEGYNPTKASVEAERAKWQQKKAAQRKGNKPSTPNTEQDPVSPGDNNGTPPENPQGTETGKHQGSPHDFPDPIPVPVPVPSSGDLGREGYVPARASAPPNPRCPKHATGPATGPCRACADARRTREAWDEQEAHRAETERLDIARCRLCDGDGRRWDPAGKHRGTVGRCDHKPLPRQESA